jgi:anti-sigma factor RsiW
MMSACDEIAGRIGLYLDGELEEAESLPFERHVSGCARCRVALEGERRFLARVRGARPLTAAPAALRQRAAEILDAAPPVAVAPQALRRRVERLIGDAPKAPRAAGVAVLATVVIFAAAVGLWEASRPRAGREGPSDLALMAVDAHLRHLEGRLPLEIASASPDAISKWFTGKVDFGVRLPNHQEVSGQERLYTPVGARLVGFKEHFAAFITYRMGSRPISLVITSSSAAAPSGGEEIVSRGLTFHFDSIGDFKVITWSDRGLAYALVSDLEERGQQSCIVCHAGTTDRAFIEGLRPRRAP